MNRAVEVFGDKWTLLILRDIIFAGKRNFRELLVSEERIASNILADRLKMMVAEGLLTRTPDPTHKQKAVYSLTEKSITLFPILAQMGLWGESQLHSAGLRPETAALLNAGPTAWKRFMAKLRAAHISAEDHADVASVRPAISAMAST